MSLFITLKPASLSAPAFRRTFTMAVWPFFEAAMSTVGVNYSTITKEVKHTTMKEGEIRGGRKRIEIGVSEQGRILQQIERRCLKHRTEAETCSTVKLNW